LTRIKTGQIQILLALIAIVAMLSWGVFAAFWTFPDDQGGQVNAALNGEYAIVSSFGPNGNGTAIRSGSEAQFIMDYQTGTPSGSVGGASLPPNGVGLVLGPISWTAPSSTLSAFDVRYAIFTFEFSSQLGPAPPLWFSGPHGNLTASLFTAKYGGLESTRPFLAFETRIFEVSGPGNYTLHYLAIGSKNSTGLVAMGPSSVTFTRPYLYFGVTTIVIAIALSATTAIALRKRVLPSAVHLHQPG
jgi:hypothetical protein